MFEIKEQLEPININDFDCAVNMPEDCLFYGTVIKSKFDLIKSNINKEFDPKKVYVILKVKKGFNIVYLYGSFIKVSPKFKELLSSLNLFSQIPGDKHSLKNYSKILKLYNLGCDESYLYFTNDIYPIDSSYSHLLFNKFSQNNFFSPNTAYPFYMTITAPYIFYFTNLKNNLINFNNFLSSQVLE